MAGLKAVFIDRDGVLSRERVDYVKTPDELELLPGISEPLSLIRKEGYLLVIVTNQSAVGRGLTTEQQVDEIHRKLLSELAKLGCKVDAVYYCPHRPEEKCSCRKPEPGLILRAAGDLGIDIENSWMVGDKDTDLEAARKAGCRSVKIPTNEGKLGYAVSMILSKDEQSVRTPE
ncbi:HAD family hydrolase [Candidatus Bathyarchaeota archaeon]|nr:MAG: HAD family hydrolase [Candidatus Bathyarchaeota archaeon]